MVGPERVLRISSLWQHHQRKAKSQLKDPCRVKNTNSKNPYNERPCNEVHKPSRETFTGHFTNEPIRQIAQVSGVPVERHLKPADANEEKVNAADDCELDWGASVKIEGGKAQPN